MCGGIPSLPGSAFRRAPGLLTLVPLLACPSGSTHEAADRLAYHIAEHAADRADHGSNEKSHHNSDYTCSHHGAHGCSGAHPVVPV